MSDCDKRFLALADEFRARYAARSGSLFAWLVELEKDESAAGFLAACRDGILGKLGEVEAWLFGGHGG